MAVAQLDLTVVRDDDRIGLAVRERCYVVARFVDELDPELRDELQRLVRRRGARAQRIPDTLGPLELLFAGSDGTERRIKPPQVRHGALRQIDFTLREPTP